MTARPARAPRPHMLTVPQAADQLGVSKMQAYRWIKSGALPFTQYPQGNGTPGGPIRIDPGDVEAFIAAHRQEAAS